MEEHPNVPPTFSDFGKFVLGVYKNFKYVDEQKKQKKVLKVLSSFETESNKQNIL